jgi:hypothetical protein
VAAKDAKGAMPTQKTDYLSSFFRLQVLLLNSAYSGQKLISPVAIKIKPSQPHALITPVTANKTNNKPMAMRAMRSFLPTFESMTISFLRT